MNRFMMALVFGLFVSMAGLAFADNTGKGANPCSVRKIASGYLVQACGLKGYCFAKELILLGEISL